MSDESLEILDPDQEVTLSSGQKVTVRELNWKAAKRFLTALAGKSSAFLSIRADGTTEFSTEKLMGVIATDLGESLILAATDLDTVAVEALSLRDTLAVLDRAVELNLRPEMIEAGKAIAGRFKALATK